MNMIFIFRRDLRLEDNNGLKYALENYKVIPIFIYNTIQINKENIYRSESAINFMSECINELKIELKKYGKKLNILKTNNNEINILENIIKKNKIEGIIENMDYTPYAKNRSNNIKLLCEKYNIKYILKEDYLLSKIGELNKKNGEPYQIFTPFKNNGLKKKVNKSEYYKYLYKNFININIESIEIIKLKIEKTVILKGGRTEGLKKLKNIKNLENYNKTRNNPNYKTSLLSAYIKFGCVSIREVYWEIKNNYNLKNELLDQLYWREFYYYIVYYYPNMLKGENFQLKYNKIKWSNNENNYIKWCNGKTGYPIVDAGMNELNKTGYMHNRLRLITSNFMNRMLNLDWRLGEKYFAKELIDYDPSVNNGNWQWIASSGVDPKPYFQRLFNPILQSKKFDPECIYIKKWLPELKDIPSNELHNWEKYYMNYDLNKINYYKPIVNYKEAREKSIETFKKIL